MIGQNCRVASFCCKHIRCEKCRISIISLSALDQRDLDDLLAMARLIGKMQDSAKIQGLLARPCETELSAMSDQAIICDFRERIGTVSHPCGTCRMGPDAAYPVVDSSLRVHGIDWLRIVDASVFPNITSANLNAPTIMLVHKAAQLILAGQTC